MLSRFVIVAILNAALVSHALASNAQSGDVGGTLHQEAAGFHITFDGDQMPGGVWASDYTHPDWWLDTAWAPDRAAATTGGLRLSIERSRVDGKPHTGAEMHTNGVHHYGRYEVVMTPAKGSGLVSSFFTWTGPQNGTPKDEIDIEFVGSDTTRVQINYFTGGKNYHGAWIDLPYDAADQPQLYAFEWDPDEIRWYVGDQMVYRADGSKLAIPTHAGSVIFNLWAGHPRLAGWTGPIHYEDGASATYHCISYAPPGDWGTRCSDHFSTDLPPVTISDGPGA